MWKIPLALPYEKEEKPRIPVSLKKFSLMNSHRAHVVLLGWRSRNISGDPLLVNPIRMALNLPLAHRGPRYLVFSVLRSQLKLPRKKTSHFNTLWRRQWHPTPVLLPGKSHGWKSLVGYSPWGRKESDTTKWLHLSKLLSITQRAIAKPENYHLAWKKLNY